MTEPPRRSLARGVATGIPISSAISIISRTILRFCLSSAAVSCTACQSSAGKDAMAEMQPGVPLSNRRMSGAREMASMFQLNGSG